MRANRAERAVASFWARALIFLGKNPINSIFLVGRPEVTAAETKAAGPGMWTTGNPARTTAATNLAPGSLTDGVPALLTKATELGILAHFVVAANLVLAIKFYLAPPR
ncbi:MAG: hypothetical protein UW60_C0021G0002 [Candidatus Woesebacteria bacterium GW2011_GWA2_44_33]|uniref:Uncharacterized protein n=1 Tax=Candidatus Woesebacteria bacterium GW2011_GWA2_44_33 TaxID=1618564 RepID=A0A0G1J4Q0_9BACT|nr:MAG: hypothetical protein UW60_C0021G0002 [Candidatus Woesebacteria bacterium GW2011_GWA2_44_33]